MAWQGTGELLFQGLYFATETPDCITSVLAEWENTLSRMAKWNFNTIRLAVFPPTTFDNFPNLIDQVIAKIASHGMKVILDVHNFDPQDAQYYGSSAWIQRWQQLATKYKNYPDIVAYELWNEPMQPTWDTTVITGWGEIPKGYALCTDAIRAIDPTRTVIWGMINPDNLAWFGATIDPYIGYADNMYFAPHKYPPITNPAYPAEDLTFFFQTLDFILSKGFKIWYGEFGPWGTTGPATSDAENQSFVLQSINFCLSRNIGFSIWEYRTDHYTYAGFYDNVLAQSNYAPIPSNVTFTFPSAYAGGNVNLGMI